MSTQKIWDLHMTYDGVVDDEFMAGAKQLAESIAEEPGVVWKIWTFQPGTTEFGSTYLFRDIEALETYKAMHSKRLAEFGITISSDYIYDVMEDLSAINNAPVLA